MTSSDEARGLKMELLRGELRKNPATPPKRIIELAAYFTHCNLQPTHTMLSLKAAMGVAFKLKLLTSAGSFARRLLERSRARPLVHNPD